MHFNVKISIRLAGILVVFAIGLIPAINAQATNTYTFTDTLNGYLRPGVHFLFNIPAGTTVTINHLCDATTPLDPEMNVTGPNGFFDNDDDSGGNCAYNYSSYLNFVAPTTGNYDIYASSYAVISRDDPTDMEAPGRFTLTVECDPGCSFVGKSAQADRVPQVGMIQIDQFQAQSAYESPGGNVAQLVGGDEVWLPADYDGSFADTYVVTDTVTVDGQIWYQIFLGSGDFIWVSGVNVTVIN